MENVPQGGVLTMSCIMCLRTFYFFPDSFSYDTWIRVHEL